jgi:hypothetical protein
VPQQKRRLHGVKLSLNTEPMIGTESCLSGSEVRDCARQGERRRVSDNARVMALFRVASEQGSLANQEKFGDLGDGIFEYKPPR